MIEGRFIKQFFELINMREMEKFGELLTDDAQFYFPKTQTLIGRERIIRFFKILFRQYPRLAFKIEREIIQGQMAAVHWSNRGVHKTGEPYDNEGVTILEMAGDKIRFISDFFKDTGKF